MRLAPVFAVSILAFAAAAVAQTQQGQQTPTPPTSKQAEQEMQSQKTDPLQIQSSDAEDWGRLKGHDKGYVAKGDMLPNSWIAENFMKCDENQDGKVTQQEYERCIKKR